MKWMFWKRGREWNCGLVALAVWLILWGLSGWPVHLQSHFRYLGDILSVLALVAGILLLLRR